MAGRVAGAAQWLRIALIALAGGIPIGWTIENVPLESLTRADWLRSLGWAAVAAMAPVAAAAAVASGVRAPTFAAVLGRRGERPRSRLVLLLGAALILLSVLAVQAALGLVFDPRYRDFPFAPLDRRGRSVCADRGLAPATRAAAGGDGAGGRRSRCRQSTSRSMKGSPTGRRSGVRAASCRSALTLLQVRDAPG